MQQLKACLAVLGAAFMGTALHTLVPEGNWFSLVMLVWGTASIAVALHD
jgi:hypothetical protein